MRDLKQKVDAVTDDKVTVTAVTDDKVQEEIVLLDVSLLFHSVSSQQ